MGTLRNLARNSLRPSYLPVMVEKLGRRLWGSRRGEARLARAWAEERAERWGDFAREQNEALWREAESWARGAEVEARKTLADLNVALGGAGAFPLLYFLVRWRRPRVVVETGVAAGYSSLAVLSSLRANGFGKLYSSDFPYFRLKDPEQYVGCLVPDELRSGWELRLEG